LPLTGGTWDEAQAVIKLAIKMASSKCVFFVLMMDYPNNKLRPITLIIACSG
jgi:hypothetical protein